MLAVSEPAQAYAKRAYSYVTEVVPNPIKLSQFANAHSSTSELTMVFLGRLVARKGALQLLKAVAYVKEQNLYQGDFKVVIGGKGEMRTELETFVMAHGLTACISFAGFIDESEKANFLAQADLAVYPSLSGESFGIVLLEGMAAGRGVVLAGNNPGYASVMVWNEQLVNPEDTPAFARQLAFWLTDGTARKRAMQQQRTYVESFDIEVVGKRLLDAYNTARVTSNVKPVI
jgi:phosphatidylinositol alpha-mannosyltransferase